MTDKQKAAFLKREGWERHPLYRHLMGDPKGKKLFHWMYLHEAMPIASKRKAAREVRRLKAAGWRWHDCGPSGFLNAGWKLNKKGFMGPHTRAEALATLSPEADR